MNIQSQIQIEHRNKKYFNLYEYRVSITISDIHKMRHHDSYDSYLNHVSLWSNPFNNKPLDNKDEINRYFDYKNSKSSDCNIRLEINKLFIYSNDLSYLQQSVNAISPILIDGVVYYKVICPKEDGVMEFAKEPLYKFREYFKSKQISYNDRLLIRDFIETQKSYGVRVKVNSTMDSILNSTNRNGYWIREGSYIEYDDERMRMIFLLTFGEYLKPKTYKLVKRQA